MSFQAAYQMITDIISSIQQSGSEIPALKKEGQVECKKEKMPQLDDFKQANKEVLE